MYTYIDHRNAK